MKTLSFAIDIAASPQKVWFVLWNDQTYRRWTSAFQQGSYALSDWKQGSHVHFLSPEGRGMYALIEKADPPHEMVFKHLGEIVNFQEQAAASEWQNASEAYRLEPIESGVRLHASVDTTEAFSGPFNEMFPKALALVKELAENFRIYLAAEVKAPVEKVWQCFTSPAHITGWNHASDDWHSPHAQNDLRAGGSFSYRMEAKDGSMGFDLSGAFDEVAAPARLAYHLDDGRKVQAEFHQQGDHTSVVQWFEPEEMHSYELQYMGWQAILNNFKAYCEKQA